LADSANANGVFDEDDGNVRVIQSAGKSNQTSSITDQLQLSGLPSAYAATLESQSHSEMAAQVDDWNANLQEL
jgi:hypothetical protein